MVLSRLKIVPTLRTQSERKVAEDHLIVQFARTSKSESESLDALAEFLTITSKSVSGPVNRTGSPGATAQEGLAPNLQIVRLCQQEIARSFAFVAERISNGLRIHERRFDSCRGRFWTVGDPVDCTRLISWDSRFDSLAVYRGFPSGELAIKNMGRNPLLTPWSVVDDAAVF